MGIDHFIPWLLILASSTACAADVGFGIIKLDGNGHALLVAARPLVAGQLVDLQYQALKGRTACCKRLKAEDFDQAVPLNVLATNEISGEAAVLYAARILRLWAQAPFIGGAAVGTKLSTKQVHGKLVASSNNGHPVRAGTCLGQEGVHLIERAGRVERTHLYLSLGYEVEEGAAMQCSDGQHSR